MRRNYTLLKDLPDVKAGAIFEFSLSENIYNLVSEEKYYSYSKEFVESNSEWFKLNVQKPPLGVVPIWLHREQRLTDLLGAIDRYREAGYKDEDEYVKEWIAEAQTIHSFLQAREEKRKKVEVTAFTLENMKYCFEQARLHSPFVGFKYHTFEHFIDRFPYEIENEK